MGSGGMGLGIGDLEGDPGPDAPPGVLRGGAFRIGSGGEGAISMFGRIPPGAAKSNWGSEWKKAGLEWFDRAADITCEAEHVAYRQHYMDLDPTYTDKFGDPLMRLTLDWTEHEKAQGAWIGEIQHSFAKAMGVKAGGTARGVGNHYDVTYYQSTHVQGGVVMGNSPANSVVNPWLQHWHMPNLWVIGGSAFPQNGSGNPTLTILAIAYRAADALVDRYLKKPGALA